MSSLIDITAVVAQASKPQAGLGPFTMVGMMFFMFGFIYFFSIRPQKQKEKKHQEEVSKLKKGDAIMLESGIYGEIFSVEADSMHIKIADKTVIKVHPRGVRVIIDSGSATATKEEV
ncbi:MAG: preprotein translocase subunit YajC [Lentisphaeraceae bacterium]|nr:preprotein translocase subunit YajC [Lentisphaeraceae bacterium]